MRYWDIAQQLRPERARLRSESFWRELVRGLAAERFAPAWGHEIDPDLAVAMSAPLRLERVADRSKWIPTVHCIGRLYAGGAERQLVNLVTGLADRGHPSQTLLSMFSLEGEGGHYLPHLLEHNVDVQVNDGRVLDDGVELMRSHPDIVDLILRIPPAFGAWTLDLWVELSLLKPQIAHFWLDHSNVWGAPAALLADIPSVILSTRNVHPENFPYLYAPYMRGWYAWLEKCPRVHFINNSRAGAHSYAEWIDVSAERFEVILNGVDLRRLAPVTATERETIRRELGIPLDARVVVGGFRLSDEKRPALFVETFARAHAVHPDLHCILMGEGPLRDVVIERAKELGVSDRFHAIGRRHDLPKVLSAMDVFLHTAWWEGTPNVVLEAQQLMLPVVVAAAGGAVDAVNDGQSGFLVPREDEMRLATALIEILNDLPAWRAKAKRGPEFVARKFGIERMLNETLALHERSLPPLARTAPRTADAQHFEAEAPVV